MDIDIPATIEAIDAVRIRLIDKSAELLNAADALAALQMEFKNLKPLPAIAAIPNTQA